MPAFLGKGKTDMNGIAKKRITYILLLAFCLLFAGCSRKQTDQELLNSTICEETDARRIVELLLEKRRELMQTIENFSSEEELLSALEEVYTAEKAGAMYAEWLCEERFGLYEKSDDGALVRKEDALLPVTYEEYEVSILSYSEEGAEAFVIWRPADLSGSGQSDYLETAELLSVTKNEQGFRLAVCGSGAIYRQYFSEEGEEAAQEDDASEIPSEEEAYDIVKELFEKWADYDYRFLGDYPAELIAIDGYDYKPYPSDSFSSMEDLLAQLGEIMTPGCVRQFQSIWLEREIPFYLEQDGVLYKVDAIVPEWTKDSVYAVVVKECGPGSIHAFVVGNEGGESDEYRMVYEIFLVKTAQGWRADQIHHGSVEIDEAWPAEDGYTFSIYTRS